MEYTVLGSTGLKASLMGLGAGGASRIGQGTGGSAEDSARVVRKALDLGVNFIDTAESYGTESIIGKVLKETDRKDVILSSKKTIAENKSLIKPRELAEGLERTLSLLGTDHVDVYHLHGVAPGEYDYAEAELLPELLKLKKQGKARFAGITEGFASDPGHEMLKRAILNLSWDVFMVGFNVLNQSARETIFPSTIENNKAILVMFALRRSLSNMNALEETVAGLKSRGLVEPGDLPDKNPLGFLVEDGSSSSVQDAAYRFCRHEPGIHVVLSGTGNLKHLASNARSICAPPLPEKHGARLRKVFSRVNDISGN